VDSAILSEKCIIVLNVVHPVVFYNNSISTEESVKHNSNIIVKIYVSDGYMFRPFKRPSSGHPLNKNSIKSKTYELLAHSGIPCGFTRVVMDKIK
jgi:hypothetical protein